MERGQNGKQRLSRVFAAADQAAFKKMNLNEYMVTLERPLGIRFALSVDGRIFVHSMKKGVSHTYMIDNFFSNY